MKNNFYLIIIIVGLYSFKSYSQSVITNHLIYGKYSIGYKVFHTFDNSRTFFPKYDYYGNRTDTPIGRPMQISMWYPSNNSTTLSKMKYKDYIGYWASEIDFNKNTPKDKTAEIDNFIKNIDVSKQAVLKNLLNEDVLPFLNAEEIEDEFPIILYAPPMNTSATDNSIICEYLSSRGYIVLSVMAKGEFTLLQSRTKRDVHTQAEDLAFLLNFAKKRYKSEKIGVFGFSLGGLANIIFASKHKGIDATVSLDGSIMSQGWLNTIESSEFFDPEYFSSNLLLIGKNLKAPEQNPSTFFDAVKYADKALIRYDHDQHGYFSGINLLYEMMFNDNLPLDKKNKNYTFYAEMTRYVGDFFDQYLKDLSSFKEYSQKRYNHSFVFENGLRKPIDPSAIGQLIIDKGYDYTNKIINDVLYHKKNYLAELDWRELQRVSTILQNKKRLDEAIETLLLSNKAFPNWYLTNHALGELYLEKGENELSIKYFKNALKDNPRFTKSLEALKQLNEVAPNYHDFKINNLDKYLGKYLVDNKRFREIYLKNDKLYIASNYWDEPIELWPFSSNLFLVESNNPKYNMQILFHFDEKGNVTSLSIRGLNSGRLNDPNLKE